MDNRALLQEDHLRAYYSAADWHCGRHSLAGDEKFCESYSVIVWWCTLIPTVPKEQIHVRVQARRKEKRGQM